MPLYYITGVSGSGKSTVLTELRRRGFEAYDVDDSLARWRHIRTGYIHPKSSVKKEQRTTEFLKNHRWTVPRQEVETLARQAQTKSIFLGGSINNEDELRDLFQVVFALKIDDETIAYRLKTRTTNDWGKQPHELQLTLAHSVATYAKYSSLGDTMLDGSQPTEKIVDEILARIA